MTSEPLSKERQMEAKDYLAYIVNEIHTTIVTTVDDERLLGWGHRKEVNP